MRRNLIAALLFVIIAAIAVRTLPLGTISGDIIVACIAATVIIVISRSGMRRP